MVKYHNRASKIMDTKYPTKTQLFSKKCHQEMILLDFLVCYEQSIYIVVQRSLLNREIVKLLSYMKDSHQNLIKFSQADNQVCIDTITVYWTYFPAKG